MPSTKGQNAKGKKPTEIDILFDYGSIDILIGDGNSNSTEKELDKVMNCLDRHQDFKSLPNQENEIKILDDKNGPVRRDGVAETIELLSSEMSARLSQKMDSIMNIIQTQVNRAISSAINDRVLPEIQNLMGNLPSDQNGTRTGTSSNDLSFGNVWKVPKTKFREKDSRSACDL